VQLNTYLMSKKLVVCGDSYNYGIGCVNLHTQPYGVLVANHFSWELIRLARGSASNYTTFLQGMYAADMPEKPHLIVLGLTSYDRIEWFSEGSPKHILPHSLENLNYHQYPPHHETLPHHNSPMHYFLHGNPKYNPRMLSEQIGGIDDCIKTRTLFPNNTYYARLDSESNRKLKLILDYYLEIFDHSIKKNYDIGMILQAYMYIKRRGINCLVLTTDIKEFERFIDSNDLMFQDWGDLTERFPDSIGSKHTSEEGHQDTALRLIAKIESMNLE